MNNNKYLHRKGNTKIKLIGNDGQPIANKEVKIEQTKHEFLFGCSEFSCINFVNGEISKDEIGIYEDRYKKFTNIFNYATLPFYWGRFEPQKGNPVIQQTKKAAQFFIEKGLKIKGHPLCWHTVTAPWLLEMSNEEIMKTQLERIKRDVTEFSGIIDIWDVINEVVIMPIFNKYDNGITRICNEYGRIGLIRKVFNEAREANPTATLLLNDFETSESYDILIEGCLEAGIKIDAIGIQSHMHQGYWGVEKTQEILSRYGRFKLPIHFTENTIVSGHIMPPEIVDLNDYVVDSWPTTEEGETRQAAEVALHYKTLFENPLVQSITWWDFVDGSWLGAPGGLLRKDGSIKPAYIELEKLIKQDWWTGETVLYTDQNGIVDVNGYLGEYSLACGSEKTKFLLEKSKEELTICIKM